MCEESHEDNMGGTHNNITGGMPGDGWRAQAKGASALSFNTTHHKLLLLLLLLCYMLYEYIRMYPQSQTLDTFTILSVMHTCIIVSPTPSYCSRVFTTYVGRHG